MKHAGNMPRKALIAAGALVVALGLIGIVPWRVSAQNSGKQDKVKQELDAKAVAQNISLFSGEMVQALNLSNDQMKQLKQLHEATLGKIRQVLTPDQQKKLDDLVKMMGMKSDHTMDALNMTPAQQGRIRDIKANAESQARAIKEDGSLTGPQKEAHMKLLAEANDKEVDQLLTPEQRKKLAAIRAQGKLQTADPILSEGQMQKLDAIKRAAGQQMEALEKDPTLSQEEKEARAKAIKQSAEAQFNQVMTPDQQKLMALHQQQMQAIHSGGFYGPESLALLGDLTDDQKQRIHAIFQEVHAQLLQILTPEQKQKLLELHSGAGKEHHP